MKYKFWETINGKIIITITIVAFIVLAAAGFLANYRVEQEFNKFLEKQEIEFQLFHGPGRLISEIAKIQKFEGMTNDFRETVGRSIIFSSILGFGISVAIGSIVSSQITRPLAKLKEAIHRVSGNNYKIKVAESGSAEIIELAKEFNSLTKELQRVEKLREELVSDVAHELKTPLTKVRGQVEGIIDGIYKSDEDQLRKTLSNLDQLEYLIEKLQELTEISAGKIKLNKSHLLLKPVIDQITDGYNGKKIEFDIKIDDKLKIDADRNRLIEILENLIGNAYKFSEKGSITVEADESKLIVKDTGPGILKKDLPYIFERFYRVEKSRNKKTGGLGLGLAIVKELVEAHGWEITVSSKKNKGSQFNILFA